MNVSGNKYFLRKNNLIKPIFIFLVLLGGVLFRFLLFPCINHDLTDALIPWYEYLMNNGGLRAISGLVDKTHFFPPYIYSPPYLYLLTLSQPLLQWFSIVEVIKIISVVFDFVAAYAVYLLVQLKYPTGWKKLTAFVVVCFTPTVFINSAYWGQFDGIYTAFLIICLYFICTRRYLLSLLFFATALAFKIQALLFAPIFVVLFFQKKISWWMFFFIPVVFMAWMIPAYMVDYPLLAPFTTYLGGATQFQAITMNTPNLYAFLPNQFYGLIVPLGTLMAAAVCIAILWSVIQNKNDFSIERIILFSLVISVVLPYVLPKMHERYFYPAALLAIVYYFFQPRIHLIPLALQATSLLSYTLFLIGDELVPISITAMINGLIVWELIHFFYYEDTTDNLAMGSWLETRPIPDP